jgi:hypothetical protein
MAGLRENLALDARLGAVELISHLDRRPVDVEHREAEPVPRLAAVVI